MTFRIDDLSFGIEITYRGEAMPSVRRSVPIAAFSSDFQITRLSTPLRLWEISHRLYGVVTYSFLLADWNAIPNPPRFMWDPLPEGFTLRWLLKQQVLEYYRGSKFFSLQGAGAVDMTVSLPSPVVPSVSLDPGLEFLLQYWQDLSGFDYVDVVWF